MLRPNSAKIGTHSSRRRTGDGRSCGVQKRWMPRREKATSEANPERISNASSPHAAFDTGSSPALPRPMWVEQGAEQAELADEAGERRHADDQQRAGNEAQAEEGHGPGNHLADHGFEIVVEVVP